MYTKASSEGSFLSALRARVGLVVGTALYGVTLAGEIAISGAARFCLAYCGAWVVGIFVGLPLRVEVFAVVVALAPVAWSLAALVSPGTAPLWRHRRGVRRAGVGEEQVVGDALARLGGDPDSVRGLCRRIWIYDSEFPGAVVRGRALVLTRGLLRCDGLMAVLGHERAHLQSLDGRLTEAVERLGFWGDPLRLPEEVMEPGEGIALAVVWSILRLLVALAGCRPTCRLLSPLWAMHWRACEYRADAYAAALGVGEDLVMHLEELEQVLDRPQAGLLRGGFEHPPVALRISRLRRLLDADVDG